MVGSAAPRAQRDAARDAPSRWQLLRDVAVFQAKLALDGLRDLLLSPISLVAALLDLVTGGDRPGRRFYDLMHLGRRSDHWIRLFSAGDRIAPNSGREPARPGAGVDGLFDTLEARLVRQYERGGATASAKHAVDRALDSVQRRPGTAGRRRAGGALDPGGDDR
ncbi:MAG: hypothetical protein JSU66_04310 [Deltaproteobacteria bacterium]|nr:MAG: hypothetical protein JSU66_04310 [Deltaproteobacteria bacterium]